MRTTFLQKSFSKCGGENIPRPFSQKSKLSMSLHIECQVDDYQIILKRSRRPLAFTSCIYKAF